MKRIGQSFASVLITTSIGVDDSALHLSLFPILLIKHVVIIYQHPAHPAPYATSQASDLDFMPDHTGDLPEM